MAFVVAVTFGNTLPSITLPGVGRLFPLRLLCLVYPFYMLITDHMAKSNQNNRFIRSNTIYQSTVIMVVMFFLTGMMSAAQCNDVKQFITGFLMYYTQFVTMIIALREIRTKKDLGYVMGALLCCTLVIGGMGIYESFSGESLFEVTYEHYLWTYNSIGTMRPRAFFFNTNNYAAYFVIVFVALWTKFQKYMLTSVLVFGFCVFTIFLTDSRLALLVIIAALFIDFALFSSGKRRILFILVGIVAMFVFGNYLLSADLFQANIKVSDENRWLTWSYCMRVIESSFFMGTGFGTASTELVKVFPLVQSPHNMFLEWIMDCGIIPVIFFVLWLGILFVYFMKQRYTTGVMLLFSFTLITIGPSSIQGAYYIWLSFGIVLKHCMLESQNKVIREANTLPIKKPKRGWV